jgi:hypothetical protein
VTGLRREVRDCFNAPIGRIVLWWKFENRDASHDCDANYNTSDDHRSSNY